MQKRIFSVVFPALMMLAACSEAPPVEKAEVKKAPEKVAGPMSGKDAYWEMYKPAREWAPDIQVLSLSSETVPGQKVEAGKAAAWTAVFASPAKMEMRTITWALEPFGEYRKGMNAAAAIKWGGPTTKSKPFSMGDVTLDSSDAQMKAATDGKGSTWIAGHANAPVSFYLGSDQRFTAPVWVVTYGTGSEKYIKALNAATGGDAK